MEFEFFTPRRLSKASVHKTGKLAFNSDAIKQMDFESDKYFKVARNKTDKDDENLYLIVASEEDKDVFKIGKAGDYYHLKIKTVLDDMGVNYQEEPLSYEIEEIKDQEFKYYKLTRR